MVGAFAAMVGGHWGPPLPSNDHGGPQWRWMRVSGRTGTPDEACPALGVSG